VMPFGRVNLLPNFEKVIVCWVIFLEQEV